MALSPLFVPNGVKLFPWWVLGPVQVLEQLPTEPTPAELWSVVLVCFQGLWQTGIGTCIGTCSVGQEGIAGFFSRVISVLTLGQPQYKPYPWKFARLTSLQLNWSQCWRLFCPTLFPPSATSKAASMQKFVPKTEGRFVFPSVFFLTHWLI